MKIKLIISIPAFVAAFLTDAPVLRGQSGDLDTAFNTGSGANASVQSLALQTDGKILVGGGFTTFNGLPRRKIARLNADGSLDMSFDPGLGANVTIYSMALQGDGKILIGGWFTAFGGIPRNRIARLNANGNLDASFNPGQGANGSVYSIVIQEDGKILICGGVTAVNNAKRNYVARLNSNGSLDNSFNPTYWPNNWVLSLASQSDGKILLAGLFSRFTNGITALVRGHIARLNPNGTLDMSFDSGNGAASLLDSPNSRILTLAIQPDEKILVGGWFDRFDGQARTNIARLNRNGDVDPSFNLGAMRNSGTYPSEPINAVVPQFDGKILIGGGFTRAGGQVRNRIARLHPDGRLDTGFGSGVGASDFVNTMALQPDGKVLIGGHFTSVGGVPQGRIARLNCNDCVWTPGNLPVPAQPTYTACLPEKEDGKDSLVVVTHGWIPLWSVPEAPWVDVMANSIRDNLSARGFNNWQVVPYKWELLAWTPEPGVAKLNAKLRGGDLGRCIAAQGWSHVHFI